MKSNLHSKYYPEQIISNGSAVLKQNDSQSFKFFCASVRAREAKQTQDKSTS